jgi:hypothetical protein
MPLASILRTIYNTINSTNNNTMDNIVTANELKTKGISAVEANAKKGLETIVTVRGKEKYIILSIEEFNHLRDCELTNALIETEEDVKKGKYNKGTIEDHIKRITDA